MDPPNENQWIALLRQEYIPLPNAKKYAEIFTKDDIGFDILEQYICTEKSLFSKGDQMRLYKLIKKKNDENSIEYLDLNLPLPADRKEQSNPPPQNPGQQNLPKENPEQQNPPQENAAQEKYPEESIPETSMMSEISTTDDIEKDEQKEKDVQQEKEIQKELTGSHKKTWPLLAVEALSELGKGNAKQIKSYIKKHHREFFDFKQKKSRNNNTIPTITTMLAANTDILFQRESVGVYSLLPNPNPVSNKRKRKSLNYKEKKETNCNDPSDCEKEPFGTDLGQRMHKKVKKTEIIDSFESSSDSSDGLSEDLYSPEDPKNGKPTRLRALVQEGLIQVGASVKCLHEENPIEGIVTPDFKIRIQNIININLTKFAKSRVAFYSPHIFFDGKSLEEIRKEYDQLQR